MQECESVPLGSDFSELRTGFDVIFNRSRSESSLSYEASLPLCMREKHLSEEWIINHPLTGAALSFSGLSRDSTVVLCWKHHPPPPPRYRFLPPGCHFGLSFWFGQEKKERVLPWGPVCSDHPSPPAVHSGLLTSTHLPPPIHRRLVTVMALWTLLCTLTN